MTWQEFRNCVGVDPDLFFPVAKWQEKEAKAVCAGCVVRQDCLEYAKSNGERFGIFGGRNFEKRAMTGYERVVLHRDRKATA